MEEWRYITWIPEIPDDKYQVSNMGNIRNMYTGKVLSTSINAKSKRVVVNLSTSSYELATRKTNTVGCKEKSKVKFVTVARCVAIAFVPLPKDIDPKYTSKLQVGYIDGDRTNIHADNLKWVMGYHVQYSIEERRMIYDIIKDHIDLSAVEIADVCSKKLNRNITPGMIRAITYQDENIPKIKQYQILNLNHHDYMKERTCRKLTKDEVKWICSLLVIYDGDITKVLKHIESRGIEIPRASIERIKYKDSYISISDEYFSYDVIKHKIIPNEDCGG